MKDVYGDLWEYPADAICITTNGFVKKNGRAVMGAGCAREAVDRYENLDLALGMLIQGTGNRVYVIPGLLDRDDVEGKPLVMFPVKHNWWEPADLQLIARSCEQAMKAADNLNLEVLALPRPGCGNGQLSYDDVRPVISELLDDRFHVITWKESP